MKKTLYKIYDFLEAFFEKHQGTGALLAVPFSAFLMVAIALVLKFILVDFLGLDFSPPAICDEVGCF